MMNQEAWSTPKPERIPRPTYWPPVLALSTILLLWGIVTSWMISLVGLFFFILSISGWIWELYHDNES